MPESVVVPRSRRALVVAIALLAGTAVVSPVAHAQSSVVKSVRQDFNGDGYQDLATGAPYATVGGRKGAGYVAVVYGSAHGLNLASRQVFTQATSGVPGTPEVGDSFGAHLTAGDLDGDGYTDLVVPAAGEDWTQGGAARHGSVTVLWGGKSGLSGGTILPGTLTDSSARVVAGDFDGDGHADLAGPSALESGPFSRGGVPARSQDISFTDADVKVLDVASGDVDGDGISDVVVLTGPFDYDDPGDQNVGHGLFYLHGSRGGLAPLTRLKDGEGRDIEGGESIALGDVNGDGRDDLVFGRPRVAYSGDGAPDPSEYGERIGVVFGTAQGPQAADPRTIDQDTSGVPGVTEPGDLFGTDVAVGDANGDGYADIAVGIPGEDFSGVTDAGTVAVIPGSASGPSGAGAKVFSQNTAGVPGTAERADRFGEAVTFLDGDHDGRADLVVGAPGENADAGSVWGFRSNASGVNGTGAVSFGAKALGTDPQLALLGAEFIH
ncbi:FG-GAP repeat protein [Streptomyces coacervatus]|uniref:FG-GAP repeat protein n=1 Tax=Streptomyces coacervatus TaxID=647381 RepID=A0ABP7IPT2_9ACTN|nr:FG-GAP-like repeat-containing protein [Streptomyces coacervatus]MDF2268582.1 FG-GAP-like repeat-containing protein [Streptomyces coacervatus]